MRKQFAVLAVGGLALGLMAVLGSAQMDKAAKPSPAAKASCELAGGKSINGGLFESASEGPQDLWGIGSVWAMCGARERMKRPRLSRPLT